MPGERHSPRQNVTTCEMTNMFDKYNIFVSNEKKVKIEKKSPSANLYWFFLIIKLLIVIYFELLSDAFNNEGCSSYSLTKRERQYRISKLNPSS